VKINAITAARKNPAIETMLVTLWSVCVISRPNHNLRKNLYLLCEIRGTFECFDNPFTNKSIRNSAFPMRYLGILMISTKHWLNLSVSREERTPR
jgi:hypothetical protein